MERDDRRMFICAERTFFCGDFRIVFRGWDAHRLHELGQDRSRVGRDDRCVYICVERSFWLCVFGIVFRGWDAHTHCKVLTSTSLPKGIHPKCEQRAKEQGAYLSTPLLGGDPVVAPIQISRLAGGLRLHGHDHEGHQLMASSGLDPGGLMLLVLHSDSPHGMMGRSRWSESVVTYLYL